MCSETKFCGICIALLADIPVGSRALSVGTNGTTRASRPCTEVAPEPASVGYWDAGAITLDVSDIKKPKFVARFDPSPPYMGHHHTVVPYKDGDFYIVLDEAWGSKNFEHSQFMWIVDNREKSNPIPVSTYQVAPDGWLTAGGRFGAHNMHEKIDNDLVFVVWYNAGLRVVDVSDPYQPKEVGYYIPAADFGRPTVQSNDIIIDESDGLIYITDRWGGGMHIVEYTG